jgi:hypothetical protein
MATFDYSKMSAIVLTLLAKFGSQATLGDGLTARTCLAVQTKTIKHTIGDSNIEIGDVEYLVDGTVTPMQGERFTCAGDSWLLATQPIPIKPADVVLAWYVYGRAG